MHVDPPHPATISPDALKDDCEVRRLRRSGPGGQHRNKVETAIQLTHRPTGVVAEASERRSQAENLAIALLRLRVRLALAVRGPADATTSQQPSDLWRRRTRGGKLAVNPAHDDFPSLLAEGLDRLAAANWDDREAAEQLGVSRTQLVRFLKIEPAALELLNSQREQQGLPPLR